MKHLFGIISLVTGILLLLHVGEIKSFDWLFEQDWSFYFVPILLIIAGLGLLSSHNHCNDEHFRNENVADVMDENARLDINTSFSGGNYDLSGERFAGAEINTFFGGVKLDLRDSVIEEDCEIKVKALFGGVEIYVSKDVRIEISSSCVMGGIENRTLHCQDGQAKVVRIKAECLLGGVEIKN